MWGRIMSWPFGVGFRGLSCRVPGCAHQAGTVALCKETACGSRATQSLALAAVGLRAHPRAPGAAPLQEGLHWGVPSQQPWLSCMSVTSCMCSALPLSAWMQRMLWAWAPQDAVRREPPLSSLVFCLFQGSTVLNYWIFGYYMPEDDWQLKSELVLDAV